MSETPKSDTQKLCTHCGGTHKGVCLRVRKIVYQYVNDVRGRPERRPTEVEYFSPTVLGDSDCIPVSTDAKSADEKAAAPAKPTRLFHAYNWSENDDSPSARVYVVRVDDPCNHFQAADLVRLELNKFYGWNAERKIKLDVWEEVWRGGESISEPQDHDTQTFTVTPDFVTAGWDGPDPAASADWADHLYSVIDQGRGDGSADYTVYTLTAPDEEAAAKLIYEKLKTQRRWENQDRVRLTVYRNTYVPGKPILDDYLHREYTATPTALTAGWKELGQSRQAYVVVFPVTDLAPIHAHAQNSLDALTAAVSYLRDEVEIHNFFDTDHYAEVYELHTHRLTPVEGKKEAEAFDTFDTKYYCVKNKGQQIDSIGFGEVDAFIQAKMKGETTKPAAKTPTDTPYLVVCHGVPVTNPWHASLVEADTGEQALHAIHTRNDALFAEDTVFTVKQCHAPLHTGVYGEYDSHFKVTSQHPLVVTRV